ncbi:MAG: flippase-like domain-containing protein [Dehalococcoidia bacterium]|nr:flippase-like domain-containing protein [Dehalococcoidia bacterium]
MNGRSGLRALLGLLVSALFLVLLLRQVDLGEVWDALREVEWPWVAAAAVPFALGLWLRALRWRLVLRAWVPVTQSEATSLMLIGLAANNLLPVRAGEVVRAVLVERLHGGSRVRVLATIVVERVFDGLVLALFLAVVLATRGGNDVLQLLALAMGLGFIVATAVLAWIAARPDAANRQLVRLLGVVPTRARPEARRWMGNFIAGLSQLSGLRGWTAVLVASAGSWGLEAMAYWFVGEGFGLGLDPWLYLGVAGAANLAIAAPSTSGGIGPFEFFAREVLVVFGATSAVATAYALALHAMILVPVVIAGLLLLWRNHLGVGVLTNVDQMSAEMESAS